MVLPLTNLRNEEIIGKRKNNMLIISFVPQIPGLSLLGFILTETVVGAHPQQVNIWIDSRVRFCDRGGNITFGDKGFMIEWDVYAREENT